ncbi:MAG TPA: hypothetical protein VMR65_12585 [Candidatus Sulfotelmatobacter sp.]|nr:hypothetical protein [Candidatus Sulfotelmatobacter sp.]
MVRRGFMRPGASAALFLLLSSSLWSPPAHADDRPIDLVPMVGFRNGANLDASQPGYPPATADASASFGLGADFYVHPDAWFETFLERQTLRFQADPNTFGIGRFDVSVDYLQFGGGYEPHPGRTRPFVSATVGLTRIGTGSGSVSDGIGFSGSIGGGMKVQIGRRAALKLELLGYATFSSSTVAVTCGPGCFVNFSGTGWYQLAARAGLAVRL